MREPAPTLVRQQRLYGPRVWLRGCRDLRASQVNGAHSGRTDRPAQDHCCDSGRVLVGLAVLHAITVISNPAEMPWRDGTHPPGDDAAGVHVAAGGAGAKVVQPHSASRGSRLSDSFGAPNRATRSSAKGRQRAATGSIGLPESRRSSQDSEDRTFTTDRCRPLCIDLNHA